MLKAQAFAKRSAQERRRMEEALPLIQERAEQDLEVVPNREQKAALGWPLVEVLLQLSFHQRYRDPQRMVSLAGEACKLASDLDPEAYPPKLRSDLQARAWANLSNALRVSERYPQAEEAIQKAHESFEQGTQDQALEAGILETEASLRRAQRQISEALSLLAKAHDLYMEAGDQHLAGRAMISKGLAYYCAQQPSESVDCLEKGLALLDHGRDPQLTQTARQALIGSLIDLHDYRRAGELLLKTDLRRSLASEPLALLRLRWVEAQILAGLGRLSQAEHAFEEVRTEFQDQRLQYDAALVGLDLAAVWLRQGNRQRARELANEILTIFRLMGIQSNIVRARQLLEKSR